MEVRVVGMQTDGREVIATGKTINIQQIRSSIEKDGGKELKVHPNPPKIVKAETKKDNTSKEDNTRD